MFEKYTGELLTPPQARKALRLGNLKIYALVKTPGLGLKMGKRFYFIRENLERYLQEESLKMRA
ncbi:MAG: hypothetical protein ACM3WV_12465 [Bacillota bacterium]